MNPKIKNGLKNMAGVFLATSCFFGLFKIYEDLSQMDAKQLGFLGAIYLLLFVSGYNKPTDAQRNTTPPNKET